jgi:hypothetical protein
VIVFGIVRAQRAFFGKRRDNNFVPFAGQEGLHHLRASKGPPVPAPWPAFRCPNQLINSQTVIGAKTMNTKLFCQLFLAGALVAGAVPASHATTLDFTVFSIGHQGTTVLHLPQATVTGLGDDLQIGTAYTGIDGLTHLVPNAVCSLNFDSYSFGTCDTDLKIAFVDDVSNLTFDVYGFNPTDFVRVTAYNSADVAIGAFDISDHDGSYGFGALSGIRWLYFDDSSDLRGGVAYANITFDVRTATVSEPAALGMMTLGLALLAILYRRRRLS